MDLAELQAVFGRGKAAGTMESYWAAWGTLTDWLDGRELADAVLADYLDLLRAGGKSPAVGNTILAAVRAAYMERGRESPAGPQARGALKEWRRAGGGRRGQAASVPWEWAELAAVQAEREGGLPGLRDAALIGVMSDALLRGGEAAALECSDFAFAEDGSATVVVQRGKGAEEPSRPLYLGPPTAARVRAWWTAAGIDGGPAFRAIHRGGWRVEGWRLSRQSVSAIIKSRAAAAGITGKVSSHSLRIGMAGSLASRGADLPELQNAGRWRDSRMPGHYAAPELSRRSAVARRIYQR